MEMELPIYKSGGHPIEKKKKRETNLNSSKKSNTKSWSNWYLFTYVFHIRDVLKKKTYIPSKYGYPGISIRYKWV